ncbi:hypothetical protein FRC03_008357 [Tulasnella sp. 419]|nr:hypothetical protein FRC03_008357 [Tulasnella sp. 419]
MLGSAASFSFFLAIGSVIRTEENIPITLQAARMQLFPPVVASRQEGAMYTATRARWMLEKQRKSFSEPHSL